MATARVHEEPEEPYYCQTFNYTCIQSFSNELHQDQLLFCNT